MYTVNGTDLQILNPSVLTNTKLAQHHLPNRGRERDLDLRISQFSVRGSYIYDVHEKLTIF